MTTEASALNLGEQRARGTRATCCLIAGAAVAFLVPEILMGTTWIILAEGGLFIVLISVAGYGVNASNYQRVNRAMILVGLCFLQARVLDFPHFGLAALAVVCLIHILFVEVSPVYRAIFFCWTLLVFVLAVLGHEPNSALIPDPDSYREYLVIHILLAAGLCAALLEVHGKFNRTLLLEVKFRTAHLAGHVGDLRVRSEVRETRQRDLQRVQIKIEKSLGEEALTQHRVAAAREQLEQFAYAASHDLKEPIRTIRSFIEVTQRRLPPALADDAGLNEHFGFIVNSANAMHAVLEKLLQYSRIGRQNEAACPLPVAQLWEAALVAARHSGKFPAAGVEAVIEPDLHLHFPPSRAKVLFAELLANALTFHDSSRPRRVVCHAERCVATDRVIIQFSDNGIGIAPEYTEQVFGLFKRLHPREVYPGTGLGLALVKRIIDAAPGARIRIESAVDEGTTVRVEI